MVVVFWKLSSRLDWVKGSLNEDRVALMYQISYRTLSNLDNSFTYLDRFFLLASSGFPLSRSHMSNYTCRLLMYNSFIVLPCELISFHVVY